jgi:RHS repeat-associated protein
MYFNNMWQVSTSAVDRRWLQSKHIFVGETRIATKNGYGEQNSGYETEHQYWYHGDHLGSAQVITDYEGELYERIEYTPYGETWIEHKYPGYTNTEIPYRFTGKELDAETGFYYYGARYLDPRTSRWLSGDPAIGDYLPQAPVNDEAKKNNGNLPGQGGVFNMVNLHVYHYAGNNPVKYTDPDGREDEENISLLKEFFDIFSLDIKVGIGLDLSIISDVNIDLFSLQGTLSSEGYEEYFSQGVSAWIVGFEQTAPLVEGQSAIDAFRYSGTKEGNIGPFRFGDNGIDLKFSFGAQAVIGIKLNISGKEILDFFNKSYTQESKK